MFGTFRKHQTWLWVILIGLMIMGLVSWQSQLGRSGNGRRATGNFGTIDDRPVTETEYRNAQAESELNYFLNTREWPDNAAVHSGWDQTQETYKRLFLIRKVEEYNIHSDPDAVAQVADEILRQVGQGQNIPLQIFEERALNPHGLTAEDFQRFIDHDLSIQQLISALSAGAGLVPPSELQSIYVQTHQELAVKAVSFAASNYLAAIPEPSPAALDQFYTNAQAEYREPDEMQLSYVCFNITNFLSGAEQKLGTNLTQLVEMKYQDLGTNVYVLGKTPEDAKTKIREILIRQTALTNAYLQALPFQTDLLARDPARPENLNAVAKDKGMEVKVTRPFDKDYGPSEIRFPQSFPISALFNLTQEEPFPDRPVQSADGVYILAFNKMIPSRIPPLEEIHTRVVEDYKYTQAMRMAQQAGQAFASVATNELARGESFAAICAVAKVNALAIPPFSQSTKSLPDDEDSIDLKTLKELAFGTRVGQVSPFEPTREGGLVVYVRERLPIDVAKMKAELPQFGGILRQERQNDAFNLWFAKEASAALRSTPAFDSHPPRS